MAGKDAFRSPRFRGEGWLLRLSRLAEDPMRLWRRLVTGGVPCTTSHSPHDLDMRRACDANVSKNVAADCWADGAAASLQRSHALQRMLAQSAAYISGHSCRWSLIRFRDGCALIGNTSTSGLFQKSHANTCSCQVLLCKLCEGH